jgi:hypothetical protein
MSRHRLAAAGGALALATLACTTGEDDSGAPAIERSIEIDCLGMSKGVPIAGTTIWRTRTFDRCVLFTSDTIPGNGIQIVTGVEAVSPQPGQGTLLVRQGDVTWVAQEGGINLTENDGDRGAGSFNVVATSGDAAGTMEITGRFDWCAFGSRTDCPYTDNGGLEKDVSIQFSDWRERAEVYASECRVLLDPETSGMQVDLQIGVWNGVNVGLWGNQCERPYVHPGTFQFRTGGVDGPGSYGPHESTDGLVVGQDSPVHLPSFELSLPLVWYGWSCLDYDHAVHVSSHATAEAPTTCTWSVEQDPGRFTLDCEQSWLRIGSEFGSSGHELHIDAACDVRTTGG